MDIIWTLLVGLLAGWLAGLAVRGYGFGVIGNIVVGVIGAFIGNWVFAVLGMGDGTGMSFVSAFVGSVILLFVAGLFRRSAI